MADNELITITDKEVYRLAFYEDILRLSNEIDCITILCRLSLHTALRKCRCERANRSRAVTSRTESFAFRRIEGDDLYELKDTRVATKVRDILNMWAMEQRLVNALVLIF